MGLRGLQFLFVKNRLVQYPRITAGQRKREVARTANYDLGSNRGLPNATHRTC